MEQTELGMSDAHIVDTLIGLTSVAQSIEIRIEAVRSLAAHLHDERAIQALKALTSLMVVTEIRVEAIKALGGRS